MKKFDGILICTDLDGTLLRNDKSVSQENLEAIERFKAGGGLFTFITGRMPYAAPNVCEAIRPNAPCGCINGGGIFDYEKREYLWCETISPKVLDIVEYIDQRMDEIGFQVNTLDHIYFCRENSAMERFRRLTGVPNLTRNYREIDEPLAKIVFGSRDGINIPRIEELYYQHPLAGEFDFISSERTLCEILPKGIHKGKGLRKMCELFGIDPARTIAVGDYNNDVEMIRAAGVGIAVANASPSAKAVADRITVSNEEHAIAQIIAEIESGEIRI